MESQNKDCRDIKKIRLLYVSGQGIGGAERIVLDLTRRLDQTRYEISVIVLGKGGCVTDQIDKKTIRVIEFGCRSGHDLIKLKQVYKFFCSNSFDIIHMNQRSILTNFMIAIIKPSVCLVYHEHGLTLLEGSYKDKLFYLFFSRMYDVFLAIHEMMVNYMVANAGRITNKIRVLENPVDVDVFSPCRKSQQKDQGENIVIGTVARLIPEKDLALFLETAKILINRIDNIEFIIIGDGPLRNNIENISKQPAFKNKVLLHGASNHVNLELKKIDIFLFTSRIEPFGITLLESLASGVPIVAAIPEAGGAIGVLNDLSGIIRSTERNPEAIALAVIDLIKNPELAKTMALAGRDYVVKHHSLEKWIVMIDRIYRQLVG